MVSSTTFSLKLNLAHRKLLLSKCEKRRNAAETLFYDFFGNDGTLRHSSFPIDERHSPHPHDLGHLVVAILTSATMAVSITISLLEQDKDKG